MSFGSKPKYDYDEERDRLAKERLAKLAKKRREARAEGSQNVRRQQRSPTVLTNPLGLGDDTLG